MANPGYVRSTDGNDADGGSTWALANATLAGAYTDATAGDTIYVSQVHSESTAGSITLTSPGTAASPCAIVCANDAAEPPTAVSTAGIITTTGTTGITFAGFAAYYGLTFNAGTGTGNAPFITIGSANPWWIKLVNCALNVVGSHTNGRINIGVSSTSTDDQAAEWENVSVSFASSSHGIIARAPLRWRGGSISGTAPTTLFLAASGGNVGDVLVDEVDLSGVSITNLVAASALNRAKFRFVNCKLPGGVNVVTGTNPGQGGPEVILVNCDSADTNYRYRKHNYLGDEYHETTVVRTGGASDGTTSFARKITTSANAKFICPFESEWLHVWCDTLASTTLTVEVVTDNVTLTDGEAWIEVSYQGTSGFPLGVHATDAKADILASAANQTTSSETWTTTGLTTPVKQKLSVTFTPQEKGWALVRVCLAKASTTMYYCPKVDKA